MGFLFWDKDQSAEALNFDFEKDSFLSVKGNAWHEDKFYWKKNCFLVQDKEVFEFIDCQIDEIEKGLAKIGFSLVYKKEGEKNDCV